MQDGSMFLKPVKKSFRVETCSELSAQTELLAVCAANLDYVLSGIVTDNETWIHQLDPDTKQESMHWKHVNSPPKKFICTQASARKNHGHNFIGLQRCSASGLPCVEYIICKGDRSRSATGPILILAVPRCT